jgi:hypothetical protein
LCGDFCVRHFPLVKHQETIPVLFAQAANRQIDFFGKMIPIVFQVGSIRNRIIERLGRRAGIAPGQTRSATIPSNCQQPRFELAVRIPSMQVIDDAHERLLRRIFGILPVAQHAKTKPEDLILESTDQVPQCDRLSCNTVADERAKFSLQVRALPLQCTQTTPGIAEFQPFGFF